MRRTVHTLLSLCALLGGSTSCSSDSGACSLIGCVSEVTASITVPVSLAELEGATLTVCRIDDCATGTLHVTSGDAAVARCEFEDSARRSCDAERVSDTEVQLNLSFRLGDEDDPEPKDEYSVRLHPADDPSGDLMPPLTKTVDYTVSRPNGDGCDPVCFTAQL